MIIKEESVFMDSYEDNDLIGDYVRSLLNDDVTVRVEYHAVSDGRHKLFIDDEELRVDAWNTPETVKELVEEYYEHETEKVMMVELYQQFPELQNSSYEIKITIKLKEEKENE